MNLINVDGLIIEGLDADRLRVMNSMTMDYTLMAYWSIHYALMYWTLVWSLSLIKAGSHVFLQLPSTLPPFLSEFGIVGFFCMMNRVNFSSCK
jgi:hypothetical protein